MKPLEAGGKHGRECGLLAIAHGCESPQSLHHRANRPGTKELLNRASPRLATSPQGAALHSAAITFRKNDPVALACAPTTATRCVRNTKPIGTKDTTVASAWIIPSRDPRLHRWLVDPHRSELGETSLAADSGEIKQLLRPGPFDFYMQAAETPTRAHNTSANRRVSRERHRALPKRSIKHDRWPARAIMLSKPLLARFDANDHLPRACRLNHHQGHLQPPERRRVLAARPQPVILRSPAGATNRGELVASRSRLGVVIPDKCLLPWPSPPHELAIAGVWWCLAHGGLCRLRLVGPTVHLTQHRRRKCARLGCDQRTKIRKPLRPRNKQWSALQTRISLSPAAIAPPSGR